MAKWIQKAIKRPGAFTAKAKAAGKGVQEYASQVLKKGSKASTRTKKQAVLAKTLKKISSTRSRAKGDSPPNLGSFLDKRISKHGAE